MNAIKTVRSVALAWSFTCFAASSYAQEPPPPAEPAPAAAPPVEPAPEAAPVAPEGVVPEAPAAEPVAPEPVAPEPAPPPPVAAPVLPDPALESRELDARIAALDAYLKDQQPRSRAYFGAWISMMGALTVGQAFQAAYSDDSGTRASYIMGSSFSGVGLALVLLSPTPGRNAYRKYTALPGDSVEDKRRKARLGEEWLEGEAKAVRRTKSWFTHVLGATLGVGGFLGLHFGFDDNLENALRTGIGTILVTELRILTRPKRAIRYLDGYRASPTTTPPPVTFALAPMMSPDAQGMMMAGRF